ncbi:MAG: S1 RNA-binding domain-containing protein, partial [Gammaproteobacteria bacterium]
MIIFNADSISSGKESGKQKVAGKIRSITDFGIFIGLDGGIDGLVHLSDISWTLPGEEAVRDFKKGDDVEAVVLSVDAERERISLGIKQVDADPVSSYIEQNPKGTVVTGTVSEVDAKGATIDLAENVQGYLRVAEISVDRVEDARQALKEGEEVEAKLVGIDRKNRVLSLSIKAKFEAEEAEAIADYSSVSEPESGPSTLGDLLKEKMTDSE